MHPHWQATDNGTPVPVRVVLKAQPHEPRFQTPPRTRTVSRRPAAIAGIALALFAGYAFTNWQGSDAVSDTPPLDASVESVPSPVAATVRITDTGMSPSTISVSPGDRIAWINETADSVLLTSTDLCDDYGCLEIALDSGETYADYAINVETTPGAYAYGSPVDAKLSGTVQVQGDDPFAAQTSITDMLRNGFEDGNPFDTPPSPIATQNTTSTPRTLSPSIPRNPNTAVPGQITAPALQTSSVSSQAPVLPENTHAAAPAFGKGKGKPGKQPETGAGTIALTGILSTAGILLATRRMFAETK